MPTTDFTLRTCGYRDLDQIRAIEKASFPDRPYTKFDFVYYLLLARSGFIVACKGRLVIGYVIAIHQGRDGLIQSIAVSPEFRGRGVGEMLMTSAINHLAGNSHRVYLKVDVNHKGTIRLYHKLSFNETGKVTKKYYPNGDDAIEMVREL